MYAKVIRRSAKREGGRLPSTTMPQLSVVICTLNRAPVLRGAIESFYAMAGSRDSEVELWIVDNGSTDGTAAVIREIADREPNLHHGFEGRIGLAHARNAGASAARGAVVAFTDDDVLFDAGWLTAMRRAIGGHPEAAAFGGRSIPRFEASRPAWLSDDLLTFFGSTGSGERRRVMVYPECPFGLNMAFRRETLRQVGEFNAALGRRGEKLMSNEDTEYFQRVARARLPVLYVPDALLFHRVPPDRTTRRWLVYRQYWQGMSDATLAQLERPRSRAGLVTRAVGEAWQVVVETCARRVSRRPARHAALRSPAAAGFRLANRIGRILGSLALGISASHESRVTHRSPG
jgi:glycosyltransferase involved in cell wall biosynthesis